MKKLIILLAVLFITIQLFAWGGWGARQATVFTQKWLRLTDLTAGRVVYVGTDGLLQDSANLTFDGSNFTAGTVTSDGIISAGEDVSQVIYIPNQTNYVGTAFMGTGGANIDNTGTDAGDFNTFIGIGTGENTTISKKNTVIGNDAGAALTEGWANTLIGYNAGSTATGDFAALEFYANTYVGESSGKNTTTGSYNSFYGTSSGLANTTGSYNNNFGIHAGDRNTTGDYNCNFGWHTGYDGLDFDKVNFFGNFAGEYARENSNLGYGYGAGRYACLGDNVFIGEDSGWYVDNIRNTGIGNDCFNTFTEDTGSAENASVVDFANNQVTITGHSFGSTGTWHNLKGSTSGVMPAGLSTAPQQWKIIDANTLECITDFFSDAGTGTLTLTPQEIYSNSTALGYNSEPDASNQIMLGDTNITTVKSSGSLGLGLPFGTAPSGKIHTATSNTGNDNYLETYDNNTTYSKLYFHKSDDDTIGALAETDNGDYLGGIYFKGVDNTSARDHGASIEVIQDGSPGVKVPTKMVFQTYSNTAANTNQLVLQTDGGISQNTYCIRKVVSQTGMTDNTATNVFTITTATGNFGGYKVNMSIMAGDDLVTGNANLATMGLDAHFVRAITSSDAGTNSAVAEISQTASANEGTGAVTDITMTVVETSELVQTIQAQVDVSAGGVADIVIIIEVIYWDLATAPVIAGS